MFYLPPTTQAWYGIFHLWHLVNAQTVSGSRTFHIVDFWWGTQIASELFLFLLCVLIFLPHPIIPCWISSVEFPLLNFLAVCFCFMTAAWLMHIYTRSLRKENRRSDRVLSSSVMRTRNHFLSYILDHGRLKGAAFPIILSQKLLKCEVWVLWKRSFHCQLTVLPSLNCLSWFLPWM